jgi:hypothetical protein
MDLVAHFLGRGPAYTYGVVEWAPGERLVMRTADGPVTERAMRRAMTRDLARLERLLESTPEP